MLASSEIVAFLTATDPDRAAEFYGVTLGLPLTERTSFALVFRSPNATLRVALAEGVVPAPYTVLGWRVQDIATTIGSLSERGVSFEQYEGMAQDARGVWRSPSGAQVAWFKDPDGNLLSLTED